MMLSKGLNWLERGVFYSWYLYLALALFVTWEVVMRYFFDAPHGWFEETVLCASLLAVFLGCGIATRQQRQISLELLYVRLKGRQRQVADIVNSAALIIACVVLCICLLQYASFLNRSEVAFSSALASPRSILVYPVVIGVALNAIFGLELLLRACRGMPSGKGGAEE